MASSSSVVRPTPTGPQVFISFRGKDVRKNFVSFLDPALREANINVFIDEDELLGADLVNLLKRIEESEIALVIFSEDFTSSHWCLDELAKMKECKDQGRLVVIPIFYKIEPSVVKYLKGKFGDNFRDMKRNHLHQPLRTQKWEEALVSIPETKGMPLAEQSDKTDKDFITSLVIKIQKLMENMAVRRRNQEIEANQGGSIVPARKPKREMNPQGSSMLPVRVPEREASHQGGSVVPSMVPARELEITHYDKPQRWTWNTITEGPDSAEIEIATSNKVYWLKIVGTLSTENLTPGTEYEAVFVVKLENDASGWELPVTLKLKVVQHDGDDDRVDRTENLKDYIGCDWVDILAGVFVVPPKATPATIIFTMYQYADDYKKKGLVVKGVTIRPTN
ncbi:PREDICTED: protein PHLOEM PROTEIN 2-LIKE A6 [Camelina sativa]|uniref:Protein PHLOEM PROTEIN 2-LIKE A6 n=1 Tax=Camelina sativa TaxID=90675 RepID=A0ABM0UIW1_CAMSA|nr:PREDICTED: protein PHLOEM PROTEIN 2-LIKE A6 [Camelina sativa]